MMHCYLATYQALLNTKNLNNLFVFIPKLPFQRLTLSSCQCDLTIAVRCFSRLVRLRPSLSITKLPCSHNSIMSASLASAARICL